MMTASFNGKPLLMTPVSQKEESKNNSKLMSSPFNLNGGAPENAEEEANKRKMR
jgi:hypothetical protein